jgi:hypothetical protein
VVVEPMNPNRHDSAVPPTTVAATLLAKACFGRRSQRQLRLSAHSDERRRESQPINLV